MGFEGRLALCGSGRSGKSAPSRLWPRRQKAIRLDWMRSVLFSSACSDHEVGRHLDWSATTRGPAPWVTTLLARLLGGTGSRESSPGSATSHAIVRSLCLAILPRLSTACLLRIGEFLTGEFRCDKLFVLVFEGGPELTAGWPFWVERLADWDRLGEQQLFGCCDTLSVSLSKLCQWPCWEQLSSGVFMDVLVGLAALLLTSLSDTSWGLRPESASMSTATKVSTKVGLGASAVILSVLLATIYVPVFFLSFFTFSLTSSREWTVVTENGLL